MPLGTLLAVFECSIPFDGSMNSPPWHPGSAATKAIGTLNLAEHEAVLSDLDGVITKTARLHAAAWKRLFDAYLAHVAAQTGRPPRRSTLKKIIDCTWMGKRATTGCAIS